MADDQHAIVDDLYTQIGKALSEWSHVEETLCSIYAMTVIHKLSDPIGAAASSFWAIISFDAKLKMTNAAIRFRIPENEELLNEWQPLFNGLPKKHRKRSELAHGTVISWRFEDPKTRKMRQDTFFVPSLYKTLNARATTYILGQVMVTDTPDTRPEQRLYRSDVKQRRKAFGAFNKRLRAFHQRLYRALELTEKDREAIAVQLLVPRKSETQTQ